MPGFPESFKIPTDIDEWMSLDVSDPNLPSRAKVFRLWLAEVFTFLKDIDDKEQQDKMIFYIIRKIQLLPSSTEDIMSFLSPLKD